MKKTALFFAMLLLLISTAGCGGEISTQENIHKRVHSAYYDVESYSARCKVIAYTSGGQNAYDCTVDYDRKNNLYSVMSDDMKIDIFPDKTVISKGENVLEAPTSGDDMSIFVNTFFKSYYESESTSLSVSAPGGETEATLLECDVMNPSENCARMKLWVSNETASPLRMQVFGKDGFMNTEIIFEEFKFC